MDLPTPTAVISWSHADPNPDPATQQHRQEEVGDLADARRASGIDVEVDLYHAQEGVDWTRWGPRMVQDRDVTLVVVGRGWRQAWEGTGDPTSGAGAGAEADVLKSLYQRDRDEFIRRVRLLRFPGSTDDDMPHGLDRVTRYTITDRSWTLSPHTPDPSSTTPASPCRSPTSNAHRDSGRPTALPARGPRETLS